MRIGELAAATGTSVRLLRYYEEQGLLESQRLDSGHRRYDDGAPVVVRRIRSLLDAGLPTRIIRDLLPCVRQDDTVAGCKLETLREHLHGLDDRIAALAETRTSLAGLVSAARADERTPVPGPDRPAGRPYDGGGDGSGTGRTRRARTTLDG